MTNIKKQIKKLSSILGLFIVSFSLVGCSSENSLLEPEYKFVHVEHGFIDPSYGGVHSHIYHFEVEQMIRQSYGIELLIKDNEEHEYKTMFPYESCFFFNSLTEDNKMDCPLCN